MLSLCLPYYRNSGMLAEQYRVWAGYPDDMKTQIEIVLVDDGSPEPALDVPRPTGLPPLRIFRVLEDRPWHQHGARNLAAREAVGPWLLLTDMDHVLPAESLRRLLGRLSDDRVHTFHRLDAPHLTPKVDAYGAPHPHPNTFALRQARYWDLGGYDEDCVGYGTDGFFRQRLFASAGAVHHADIPVIRYPREVVPDASTRAPEGVSPKAFRDAARRTHRNRTVVNDKLVSGERPTVLAFPWERVL